MIPDKFKTMMGIKDQQDLKMANSIWKMLDQMSSNDPSAYEKFIQKNLSEGLGEAKAEKQKKQKPFKITPQQYLLLQMNASLEEEAFNGEQDAKFKQKLDININKQKWSDVKSKFNQKIRIFLNICHSERVKNPTSKSNGGQQIKQFSLTMLKDIESLYYSLQGPVIEGEKQKQPKWYFCMIFPTMFVKSFENMPNGIKVLLGLSVAYFQQRLKADRNPIYNKVNTQALYGKNLFYTIQRQTMALNQNKKFKFGKQQKICQFLLQKQIDTKQRAQQSKNSQQNIKTKQVKPKQIQIKLKQQPTEKKQAQMTNLLTNQTQAPKKILIEQITDQYSFEKNDYSIPYEMKEDENGYYFEFLVGVDKITDLDLQINKGILKLKTVNKEPQKSIKIFLKKQVDVDNVRAKMKKKSHTLQVHLNFIKQ